MPRSVPPWLFAGSSFSAERGHIEPMFLQEPCGPASAATEVKRSRSYDATRENRGQVTVRQVVGVSELKCGVCGGAVHIFIAVNEVHRSISFLEFPCLLSFSETVTTTRLGACPSSKLRASAE